MDKSSGVPTMGWTRRSAAVTVLLAMEEQRKRMGQRVALLREQQHLTQEDLAHKADVSVKTVSRFENGKHEGRADTARKIAAALGVDPSDLMPPVAPLGLGEPSQIDRLEEKVDILLESVTQMAKDALERDEEIAALRRDLQRVIAAPKRRGQGGQG